MVCSKTQKKNLLGFEALWFQTTASGFGGDDCKDVQHFVGRRHFPEQSEIHNRSAKIEEDESRSGRYELISTDFELDILVKNSRKSRCDQIRRAFRAAQAITSPPICLSFVPFHRDSCFHNNLLRTIDSGNISALVRLDLSAAFDTVDHSIM